MSVILLDGIIGRGINQEIQFVKRIRFTIDFHYIAIKTPSNIPNSAYIFLYC